MKNNNLLLFAQRSEMTNKKKKMKKVQTKNRVEKI